MITTPHGEICVRDDGNVTYPKTIPLNQAAKEFWAEVAKMYPFNEAKACDESIGPRLY
jgi:hypothetical protein